MPSACTRGFPRVPGTNFIQKHFCEIASCVTKNGLQYGRFSIFAFFSGSQNSFLFLSIFSRKTINHMSRNVLRFSRFKQVISFVYAL